MKLAIIFLVLAFMACASALPAKEKKKTTFNQCERQCPDEEKVICGHGDGLKLSFLNQCVMDKYICESKKALKKHADGPCPENPNIRLS